MGYELGPCQILYGDVGTSEGGLTDLGKTLGGVNFTVEETFQELRTDQDGESPVGETITGTKVKIAANLTDITLANLAFILKSTVITDGAKQKVLVSPNSGYSLLDNARKVVLKPYVDGSASTDANDWITLTKAGIRAAIDLAYNSNDQRVIAFEATGYVDDNDTIAVLGDETASA